MRIFFAVLLSILISASAVEARREGYIEPNRINIPGSTVATLPSAPVLGDIHRVTDGATASDCATGSGTDDHICKYNGAVWVAVGGTTTPTFITQTASAELTNEQALSALTTGLLKNTTTTGILSVATAGTDYAVGSTGLAGGQTIAGGTLTTQGLTLRANAADTTTGTVAIATSTASTSRTTGALIVTGGLGVAGTINAPIFDTDVTAAGVALSGTTLAADGTDSNIDINVTPKGTGSLVVEGAVVADIDINNQTGTTYQFVLTDRKKLVRLSNAATITVTVPANATVAFPIGTQIDCSQAGAGKVTFAAAGGVTINSAASQLSIAMQHSGATLLKVDTNTWLLVGDLTT